jgi:hypothetical protein
MGETLADELSLAAKTILLPALSKKVREKFGVEISERLLAALESRRASHKAKAPSRKAAARKGGKKAAAKKRAAKRTAKKGGAK